MRENTKQLVEFRLKQPIESAKAKKSKKNSYSFNAPDYILNYSDMLEKVNDEYIEINRDRFMELANQFQYFIEIDTAVLNGRLRHVVNDLSEYRILKHLGLMSKYESEVKIKFHVNALRAEDGCLVHRYVKDIELRVPSIIRDESEYNRILDSVTQDLDPKMAAYISSEAWSRGHSSGYEEVINIAKDMVSSLESHGVI